MGQLRALLVAITARVVMVILVIAVLSFGRSYGATSPDVTSEQLLRLLRAKDAELDNVRLDCTVSGVMTTVPYPAWKYPELAKRNGWENEKPQQIPFCYTETYVRRWPEATFIRELDPNVKPDQQTGTAMLPYQKWTNRDGLAKEITRTSDSGRGHGILEIRRGGYPVDLTQEHGMGIEFAHGLGFGQRIKTIDSVTREGNSLRVEGSIQIWWEDESRFSLLLDENLLVREATIEANVGGKVNHFEVTTSGLVDHDGLLFAASGSFKRTRMGKLQDGELTGKPKVLKDYHTEFVSLKTNLTDEEYEVLTDMTPEEGIQVNDRISGMTWFVGEPNRIVRAAGIAALEDMMAEELAAPPPTAAEAGDGTSGMAASSQGLAGAPPPASEPPAVLWPRAVTAGVCVVLIVLAVTVALTIRRRKSREKL